MSKQLLKALPKMAKAARSAQLEALLQTHLSETEGQVKRLNEDLKLLGIPRRDVRARAARGSAQKRQRQLRNDTPHRDPGHYPLNDFDRLVGAHEQGRERLGASAHPARLP